MGRELILKIGGVGGYGFHERAVFIGLCSEYFLEYPEIDIADGVVFFGTLGGGIESEMTEVRLQLSSDE